MTTEEPTTKPIPKDDNEPATKGDVKRSQEDLAEILGNAIARASDTLRQEVTNQISHSETRMTVVFEKRMAVDKQEIMDHFDVVVENIHQDVAGANKDEITLIKNEKLPDLEERVQKLEKHNKLPVGPKHATPA